MKIYIAQKLSKILFQIKHLFQIDFGMILKFFLEIIGLSYENLYFFED